MKTLSYATNPPARRRRFTCRVALSSALLLLATYLFSYYGYVRHRWEGTWRDRATFSLDYERVPPRLSGLLQAIHTPLRWIDERRLCRVYDTSGPRDIPDFDHVPDFVIDSRRHRPKSSSSAAVSPPTTARTDNSRETMNAAPGATGAASQIQNGVH